MSSILKALKKLEHEKTDRFPTSLKIDSDILKTVDTPRSFSPLAVTMVLLLVFGGGVAITYYHMKELKTLPATVKHQPAVAAAPQSSTSPPTAAEPLIPETVVVPVHTERSVPVSNELQMPAALGNMVKPGTVPVRAIAPAQPDKPQGLGEISKGALQTAVIPLLRVNGIAYQNNSADSAAIVNGTPVSTGTAVEGAIVEEIRNDRVLFQCNGEKFEVLLGQSNR